MKMLVLMYYFRAAQQLTNNDPLEVVEERKNMVLMAFINSLGLSSKEVNDFLQGQRAPQPVVDNNDLILNPLRNQIILGEEG